jgi:hypothetical protein
MDEKEISSWNDLEEELFDLHNKYKEKEFEFLYRGYTDSTWKLRTSLERKIDRKISLSEYYRFISVTKAKIETVTDKTWNIKTINEYDNYLQEARSDLITGFPACDYFAYLRHHGFPSPLLDWSRSPYVAAYFAMNEANENEN